ncbi:MAG: CHASE domain-containing protein, partial [Planctomycetes bacterium]|nr:CHASE domain-containing protein [Planctomycetota bacterium]
VARVPDAERTKYEAAARRDGFEDFQITEEDARGRMVRASRRDEYFPVSFVEPYHGNEAAVGLDLASEPARREALDRARDTGEVAASARVRLVQDTGGPFGLLVVLPIYHKGTPTDTVEDRRKNLQGFVLGVFRPTDIVEKALACLQPESIDVRLTDESAPAGKRSLHWHWAHARKPPAEPGSRQAEYERKDMCYATTFDVGGRRWSVLATPAPDFIAVRRTWQPWGMLAAGLLFSGLLAAYLTIGSRQTARIERLVDERTGELRKSEEALRKKEEQLRQTQKLEAVGQLAGGIAHEFNNLLQAVGGYTKYAMEGLSPEEKRWQDLQQVRKATKRAAALTRQLLGFSRRRPLERRHVDPNQVVVDLIKMVRPIIGEHIQLESQLGDMAGTVYADPGELQQTLLNLCLNARDAMPAGGKLSLESEAAVLTEAFCEFRPDVKPGRYVVLSVSDTGSGISPEVKPHIFEPFFTTKEVGEGAGLGLATVYGVVQQHEGAIRVHGNPDGGATFKVYLPVVDVAADGDVVENDAPAPGGNETILVAEDDSMVRDVARRILEGAGYTVVAAADGKEALEKYEANRGDVALVLLDAIMPEFTGHEVYGRIKAMDPETRIVFCTGYDPHTAQSDFIKRESLRLVEKPFDADVLLRAVREVLDREEPCLAAQATI